jgi:hypothetical protein
MTTAVSMEVDSSERNSGNVDIDRWAAASGSIPQCDAAGASRKLDYRHVRI